MCGGSLRAIARGWWRARKSSTAPPTGTMTKTADCRFTGLRPSAEGVLEPAEEAAVLFVVPYGSAPRPRPAARAARAALVEPPRNVDARMHMEVAATPCPRARASPGPAAPARRRAGCPPGSRPRARPRARHADASCRAPPASSSPRRRCGGRPRRARCPAAADPNLHEDVAGRAAERRRRAPRRAHGFAARPRSRPARRSRACGPASVRPIPSQVAHGVSTTRPMPSQRGQVPVRTNWPKTLCETCCTRPAPPQTSHVTGDVPGAAPSPPHVSHVRATRIGAVTVMPVNASASVISALTATSPPRLGPPRRVAWPKSDSPKKAPKMSERCPRSKSAGVKPRPRRPSCPKRS